MERLVKLTFGMCLTLVFASQLSSAEEAEWIWSPEHEKESVPPSDCHFRTQFVIRSPEAGQISIAADDRYELYVNGRRIGSGQSAKKLDKYDITKVLTNGRNLIAVKVQNTHGSTAAMAARVSIKEKDGQWKSFSTDDTWRTQLKPLPLWFTALYNDSRWQVAQSFGRLGETVPWDQTESVAEAAREAKAKDAPVEMQDNERFLLGEEFEIERVIEADATGSLISMTFNEFGHVVCAKEGGGLLLVHDTNSDGIVDKVRNYCDTVKNCQGVLCLNGDVFVTGDGPDGNALYRLTDKDRNGVLEQSETLLKFTGNAGEHGPHGIRLGPDGFLYIIVGNHSQVDAAIDGQSPHHGFYEGDLVEPRYEDPGGHAVGVEVPGGTIIRTDVRAQKVQLLAGGLRNAYDLAFNQEGDLFTWDSDMESDQGTTWYRPTKIFHIASGGEYGWRSGWSKWPEYFVDSLPAMLDTGRGSPTGVAVYNHYKFPKKYQNALFVADWAQGRILAVTMKPNGASFTANSEIFLEGNPLNITDLEVGPDGHLYFVTGGRGTGGGLYRVRWTGKPPANAANLGEGLNAVIRQPQADAAWSRQKIATEKVRMGERWNKLLPGVAMSTSNPWYYRTRALDLMQLFGPTPTADLLVELAAAKNERVRGKAASLMGLHANSATQAALVKMLDDSDRMVRRKACEALVRAGQTPPLESLTKLLESDDRFESWAARRLLENLPAEEIRKVALQSESHRLTIQGCLALIIAHPTDENARLTIDRISESMSEFVSDKDFIDLLRVLQVALIRSKIPQDELSSFRELIAAEFPSGDDIMNRELVRLLAHLQVSSIMDRYIAQLESPDVPDLEKLHLALHLRFIPDGWEPGHRLAVLDFLEKAEKRKGGDSYQRYVMNVTRDFAKNITEPEARLILAKGASRPVASVGALYKLPNDLDDETRTLLTDLYDDLIDVEDDSFHMLKVGIIAVLSRSGDEASLSYLRDVWEVDPERRVAIATGLAQTPNEANWAHLIRSLTVLDGPPAREVLGKLRTINLAPEEAEYYRQVILCGLRLGQDGAEQAVVLLEFWTDQRLGDPNDGWKEKIAAWQEWYAEQWPDRPEAKLPEAADQQKWEFEDLLKHLTSDEGSAGEVESGLLVYKKAQCDKCHRFGEQGVSVGPELTNVSRRFMKKEVLQAILYPSHVISDQYMSKTVITVKGKQYTGIVAPGGAGETVITQSDGKKITIANDSIDETIPSKISVMPANLLDDLTLKEISDLFAFIRSTPNRTRVVNRASDTTTE